VFDVGVIDKTRIIVVVFPDYRVGIETKNLQGEKRETWTANSSLSVFTGFAFPTNRDTDMADQLIFKTADAAVVETMKQNPCLFCIACSPMSWKDFAGPWAVNGGSAGRCTT
jgi:hypothetical protein